MLSKRTAPLSFSLWILTPDPSPVQSPAETEMNRPLSVAIPHGSYCSMRPTLDDVLTNTAPYPYTLSAFTAYLSQNHCLETLEFTMDAKRYADTYRSVSRQLGESPIYTECQQTQHLRMLWRRLISAYVVPGSPREINLSCEVRDDLLEHAAAGNPPIPQILDPAVRRIHDLMEESIFIPFLNSLSAPSDLPCFDAEGRISLPPSNPDSGLIRRVTSRGGRRVSPQSSLTEFLPQRSSTSFTGRTSRVGLSSFNRSNRTSTSGDLGSPTLSDDSGSMLPSPVASEPVTPPTTPLSNDIYPAFSPKSKGDNPFKKMGMKFGFGKKAGGGPSSRDMGPHGGLE